MWKGISNDLVGKGREYKEEKLLSSCSKACHFRNGKYKVEKIFCVYIMHKNEIFDWEILTVCSKRKSCFCTGWLLTNSCQVHLFEIFTKNSLVWHKAKTVEYSVRLKLTILMIIYLLWKTMQWGQISQYNGLRKC